MPYFLYKPHNISGLGGVFPNPSTLKNVRLGIANKEGYYLGYCEDPDDLLPINEYIVTFIDDEIAEGFKLLGVDKIPVKPLDPTNKDFRSLTDKEKQLQKKAYNLLLKLKVRPKIYNSVGDVDDLLADLYKRVDMLERLLLRLTYYYFNNEPIPEDIKSHYLPFIQKYLHAIDEEGIKTRIDIEDPNEIFDRLKERISKLTTIIKTEYLDNLEK